MQFLSSLGIVLLGYILGSIPFGFLMVKWRTGQDVRQVQSGRTGGTNVMRAAGTWTGVLTGALDILKGFASVQLALWLAPGQPWVAVFAPLATIIGHNYSVFLMREDENGRLRFSGGAGGATAGGGAMGLWFPSLFIILPIALLIWYFLGYASVTTLSIALVATIIFAVRAAMGLAPWEYIVYGVLALGVVAWALRPNIKRLLEGNERLHGYRARKQEKPSAAKPSVSGEEKKAKRVMSATPANH